MANPNFSACDNAVGDLEAGVIDARVLSMLAAIAETHSIYVCPLKSGHYQCIGSGSLEDNPTCTESHHWYGRGADISVIDGVEVSDSHAGAYGLVRWLATLPPNASRPNVGSPFDGFDGIGGFFSDSDHEDHIHLGSCGERWADGEWVNSCG